VVTAGGEPAMVGPAARRAADSWWAFLDEREAAGTSPGQCTSSSRIQN
jgi:hypothetical protein